jgi:drug/metabolite transporter (DMT)-like permease
MKLNVWQWIGVVVVVVGVILLIWRESTEDDKPADNNTPAATQSAY